MRLVDADKIFKRFQKVATTLYEKNSTRYQMVIAIMDGIKNAPTIDAVEVVRCKDCKHKERCGVRDTFYCAAGERKETAE